MYCEFGQICGILSINVSLFEFNFGCVVGAAFSHHDALCLPVSMAGQRSLGLYLIKVLLSSVSVTV